MTSAWEMPDIGKAFLRLFIIMAIGRAVSSSVSQRPVKGLKSNGSGVGDGVGVGVGAGEGESIAVGEGLGGGSEGAGDFFEQPEKTIAKQRQTATSRFMEENLNQLFSRRQKT